MQNCPNAQNNIIGSYSTIPVYQHDRGPVVSFKNVIQFLIRKIDIYLEKNGVW